MPANVFEYFTTGDVSLFILPCILLNPPFEINFLPLFLGELAMVLDLRRLARQSSLVSDGTTVAQLQISPAQNNA
jgi:hypothetical protein